MVFHSGCGRCCCTALAWTGWFPNSLASSTSSLQPSGNGQPIPAAMARSRYWWTVPSPIPQLRAIWRCPNPNSNLNRRTSLIFRMDFLLAGTLSSLLDGVSMPGDCPASLHLLLFVCGKHSAPSRTPFRQATKTVRLPTGIGVHLQTGMLFGITTESCSASDRNRVHLRTDSPTAARLTISVSAQEGNLRGSHEAVKLKFTDWYPIKHLVVECLTMTQLLFPLANEMPSGLCGVRWRQQTFEGRL